LEKKKIALRMLLGMLHYNANELAKLDADYKAKLDQINASMQWKSPDVNTYTIIKDGKVEFNEDGIMDNPTFTISCDDLDLALEIFKGRNPISEAIKNEQVAVTGDKDALLKITFYLEAFIPLLGELTGVG
jgi:hypothetical protein